MKSSKKCSNVNFTKRVDHGPGHVSKKNRPEPAICALCGAAYSKKHWTIDADIIKKLKLKESSITKVTCPACARSANHDPGGCLYIDQELLTLQPIEIENVMRNEERSFRLQIPWRGL